jgi:predicted transcriptional regulator
MPKIVPDNLKKSARIELRVQPHLDRNLRSLAIAGDRSISALVTEAIELYLSDQLKTPAA